MNVTLSADRLGWARLRGLLPSRADVAAMRRSAPHRRCCGADGRGDGLAAALPLGFGVSCGPGAAARLATAIGARVKAAVFGGSHVQMRGPTGAMTVVLVPIVAKYGRARCRHRDHTVEVG